MHQEESGAYTGEVSAPMLTDLHVRGVVLGHSERRQYFNETDRALAEKVPAALDAGLQPILCVGETEEERERDETQRKLRHQVQEALERVPDDRLADVVIAYEPIWAIGTGQVATPEQAQEAIAFIRALVGDRSKEAAERVRVQYGGSVKPENAAEILSQPDVDGALVGGASLDPKDFAADRRRRGAVSGRPAVRVCLVILDGWGLAPPGPGNAVELADTPVFDRLWAEHPHTQLDRVRPRGRAAGRADGQLRGRPPEPRRRRGRAPGPDADRRRDRRRQLLRRTRRSGARARVARERGRLHLLGLVSRGGVHSSMDHLRALIELAGREEVPDTIVHAFTDGRDTQPDVGCRLRRRGRGVGRLADRDGRRPLLRDGPRPAPRSARSAPTTRSSTGEAEHTAPTGEAAVRAAYERGETDEFIVPTLVGEEGRVREGDAVVFFNFRPDRARQLLRADRPARRADDDDRVPRGLDLSGRLPAGAPAVTLASFLAERGHRPAARRGDREVRARHVLLQRRRGGAVRGRGALARGLSARRADLRLQARDERARGGRRRSSSTGRADDYGFGIINFANPDMVGHTGSIPAATAACETVDECLGQVVDAVHASGGACIVTADHGNADDMLEPDGSPNTAHSLNPVPLVVTAQVAELRAGGILADVAPTVLELMGIDPPAEMTGSSLLRS